MLDTYIGKDTRSPAGDVVSLPMYVSGLILM